MNVTPIMGGIAARWASLRRRKLVEWSAAYLPAGWCILQVLEGSLDTRGAGSDYRRFFTFVGNRLFGFYRIETVTRQVGDAEPIPANQYETAFIIYAPSGHMAVHLMRPGREPFAGPRPTPEEALAAVQTYGSYFGPFSVHEDEGYLVHHQIGNLSPGGMSDAQRFYELTERHLTLRPPAGTDGQGRRVQSASRWARISD